MNFCKVVFSALVFATMIAVGSASAVCSNATLNGSYGTLLFGGRGGNVATLADLVADGNGNLSGTFTTSDNGSLVTATFTGTYSVAKNCTGSFTLTLPDSHTSSFNFVLDDAKKGLQMIQTDSGHTSSGYALAQGTVVPCGLTGKKQTFAANFAGFGAPHTIAAVGQVTLSGTGTLVPGRMVTISIDGTIGNFSVTGTYTVNSDCTGTAQITLVGLSTSNYNLVVVNGGKEILLIETENNTVVTGTMQQ